MRGSSRTPRAGEASTQGSHAVGGRRADGRLEVLPVEVQPPRLAEAQLAPRSLGQGAAPRTPAGAGPPLLMAPLMCPLMSPLMLKPVFLPNTSLLLQSAVNVDLYVRLNVGIKVRPTGGVNVVVYVGANVGVNVVVNVGTRSERVLLACAVVPVRCVFLSALICVGPQSSRMQGKP